MLITLECSATPRKGSRIQLQTKAEAGPMSVWFKSIYCLFFLCYFSQIGREKAAKMFVPNSTLGTIFWRKMRTYPECSHGFPIAIVPDSRSGWKALTAPYVVRRYPRCAKRVEEAQNELRNI
jgi:hypothetical protein